MSALTPRLYDGHPSVNDETSLNWALQEIEAYEAKHHPIGLPGPIKTRNTRMADKNNSRQLCEVTGDW